jgi:hypothetical protein
LGPVITVSVMLRPGGSADITPSGQFTAPNPSAGLLSTSPIIAIVSGHCQVLTEAVGSGRCYGFRFQWSGSLARTSADCPVAPRRSICCWYLSTGLGRERRGWLCDAGYLGWSQLLYCQSSPSEN